MEAKKETNEAEAQAGRQLEGVCKMVRALRKAQKSKYQDKIDEAEQAIHEDPLSVEVRSAWYTLSQNADTKPAEFKILLSTGGPACQIVGELTEHGEPQKPRIQHQDWFKPWEDLWVSETQEALLLEYCQQFYFGE